MVISFLSSVFITQPVKVGGGKVNGFKKSKSIHFNELIYMEGCDVMASDNH